MSLFRPMGCRPDSVLQWQTDMRLRPFLPTGSAAPESLIQPVAWIREQPLLGDCTGEAWAACLDAVHGAPPWASGVAIWREALRRGGYPIEADQGAPLATAADGLIARGWSPYRPGEWTDLESARLGPDLADELAATDRRQFAAIRYRIGQEGAARLEAVRDALSRGFGLVMGTTVRAPFQALRAVTSGDLVTVGTDLLGSGSPQDGHALRLIGWTVEDGEMVGYGQNSWGEDWGGCTAPDGTTWLPGCFRMRAAVILGAFDLHALQVVR
jgi:hypothetical protein